MFAHWHNIPAVGLNPRFVGSPIFATGKFNNGLRIGRSTSEFDMVIYDMASSADWVTLGYTIECWLYITNSGAVGSAISEQNVLSFSGINNPSIKFTPTSDSAVTIFGTSVSVGAWHHIAMTRDTGAPGDKYWVNGVGTFTTVNGEPQRNIYIGNNASGTIDDSPVLYTIDELRISNNVRYTSNFTPPSSAFTSDANTWFLAHFDDSYTLS